MKSINKIYHIDKLNVKNNSLPNWIPKSLQQNPRTIN